MSNETLGIRVDLTGNKAAVDGLQGVTNAEKQLADATGKINAANKDVKTSGDALNTTINQTAASSSRGGEALRELETRSRSLASSQQNVASSMASGVAQTGLLARAGGALTAVLGAIGIASAVMGAALAVAAPAAYFTHASDEARVTLARINGITGSLTESRKVYAGLVDDAIRLRVTQDATLTGYTRIAAAVNELGGTSTQARQINEIVLATAKASGIAADEAAAAARQFAQALGSGVLQGDELRSIMENNQELARQLAKGLNVSVSELRKMGAEGTLTADVVANALLSRLPEIRAKLAEVPLTSADAWTKLTAVLNRWVLQGDQVEMKAGLIARAMNAIADGIDRSRSAASTPITVTVREVYQSEGGAAFIGPNRGRRDPAAIAAEQQAAINAASTLRGSALAAIRAADNEMIQASRLGLEIVGKKALEGLEKYADTMMLGSAKIQKAFEKESKLLAASKAKLEVALSSGDPATVALAKGQLAKIAELEVKAVTDTARKIAEARKSEASKSGADAKAAQANTYREAIAQQEGFQQAIQEAMTAESEALKRQYDARKITAQDYYTSLAATRLIALAQQQESVQQELDIARAAVARGDATKKADVAKYEAEILRFAAKRIKVTEETEDAITAIEKRARDERDRATAEANQRFNDYINSSGDLVRAMREENEQRQFELSLIGLTEQAAGQMQARRQAELTMRRALTQAYREYIAALNNSDSSDRDAAITDAYNKQIAGIRTVADEQADLTVKVQQTGSAYSQMSTFVDGFINAAFSGFKSLKDFLKNQLFDWLKQSLLKPFIMQIAASVVGGGGVAGAAASAFGGGGAGTSLLGSLAGSALGGIGSAISAGLVGPGSALGSALGLGSAVGAPTALAGAGVAGGSGTLLGGISSVLATIPVWGWIVLAAGALAVALGKRDPGFKIDNNLTNVGNPASHFTANAISAYDISGRGTDAPEVQAALKPLTTAVNTIDALLADKLLGKDVIDKIRANMNQVNNASSWENLDAKGIEKGTLNFLMQRYGVIFDQVDAKIAASVRGFTGTSEELLRFIGGVVAVMQTLKDNAAYFKAVIGESVSVGQIAALQKEGESLDQTLTRVVNVFTATNGVAALLGQSVATAFGEIGLASLAARQNLVDLAGGIQSLDSMSQFYYEHFYTAQERGARELAAANATVVATFAEMNIAVPASRDAFRALVESQDLTTESGRRTFVALMRVAGAFDTATAAATAHMEVVGPRDGTSMGPGVVNNTAANTTQQYLDLFFTDAERRARKLADSTSMVNDVFARLGVAAPHTRAEFRAIVEGLDLTTETGRVMYNMLMTVVGAFGDMTESANELSTRLYLVFADGTQIATDRLASMFAIIDSTGESTQIKLQRKLAASGALAAELDASYNALVAANGGVVNTLAFAMAQARNQVLAQQATLAGNLALFVSLQAQYGGYAEQMYELELWRQAQIAAANGSATDLLLIEQSYAARRNAILAGGLATGLTAMSTTLKDWLAKLLLNDQLSTLSPLQRLTEARAQYESALTSGNASQITGAADAYLREARSYFASSAAYDAIFNIVRAQVTALANGQTPTPTPTPVQPTPTGNVGGGNAINGGSGNATAARDTAVATSNAETMNAVVALLAKVNYKLGDEGKADRDSRDESTRKIVDAVARPGSLRVAV